MFKKQCIFAKYWAPYFKKMFFCPDDWNEENFVSSFVEKTMIYFTLNIVSYNPRKCVKTQNEAGWKAAQCKKYDQFACGKCTAKIRSTVFSQCVIKHKNYVNRTDTFYMTLFLDTSLLECKHISHHPLQIRPIVISKNAINQDFVITLGVFHLVRLTMIERLKSARLSNNMPVQVSCKHVVFECLLLYHYHYHHYTICNRKWTTLSVRSHQILFG